MTDKEKAIELLKAIRDMTPKELFPYSIETSEKARQVLEDDYLIDVCTSLVSRGCDNKEKMKRALRAGLRIVPQKEYELAIKFLEDSIKGTKSERRIYAFNRVLNDEELLCRVANIMELGYTEQEIYWGILRYHIT